MLKQNLTDVTRGLQYAAGSAISLLAEQYVLMFKQFFDLDQEHNLLRAKMVQVQIDDRHVTLVPLVSLVSPSGLALKQMRVHLSVRVEETAPKRATSADNARDLIERTSFAVSLSPKPPRRDGVRRRSDIVDLELEFVAADPPELIHRVLEELTNTAQPRELGPDDGVPLPLTPNVISPTELARWFAEQGEESQTD